ncbi:hypothetical protein L5G32_17650 [Gordonia sp. HY002]|uniref:hypothetical protein n=1 Tax=Gordonia zhenghanii TaxID=2911516 RepID=UPI001EF09377|nr:hypothetical protein [Gordonia zhenghanii]MCF8572096.1 hypothetical protein [Gordonia zhenghanii]MCF8602970.1 hypothetical protein [Gordonia zhenghanii]
MTNHRRTTTAVMALVAAGAMAAAGCSTDGANQASPNSSTPQSHVSTPETVESTPDSTVQEGSPEVTVATAQPETTSGTAPEQTPGVTQATTDETDETAEETAEPDVCSSASADTLASVAAASSVGYRLVKPIVFSRVDCVGTTAVAHTAVDGVHQPTGVLFVRSGGWIAVGVGSAMDCVALGAPARDAAQLEGCL